MEWIRAVLRLCRVGGQRQVEPPVIHGLTAKQWMGADFLFWKSQKVIGQQMQKSRKKPLLLFLLKILKSIYISFLKWSKKSTKCTSSSVLLYPNKKISKWASVLLYPTKKYQSEHQFSYIPPKKYQSEHQFSYIPLKNIKWASILLYPTKKIS